MLLAIASELSVLCVVSLPIIHPYYHYPSSIHTVESEHPGVGGARARGVTTLDSKVVTPPRQASTAEKGDTKSCLSMRHVPVWRRRHRQPCWPPCLQHTRAHETVMRSTPLKYTTQHASTHAQCDVRERTCPEAHAMNT